MDPSVSFATHSNLEDRWHKLLPEERAQADILLADASEIIRNRVRPYPETHDPAWWLAHGGQTGVTQSTETTGPFSSTYSWLSPDGYLRFTDDMLRNLGLSGQRMWSIDMAEGSHHGAC